MNAAVIVENRLNDKDLAAVVKRHKDFLSNDWCIIPLKANIQSPADYNTFITSVRFWEPLTEFNRVLIFQHDSGLLRTGIEEFMEYDYVGAPWKKEAPWARKDRAGGNDGLSLRCPKKSLDLIRESGYHPRHGNEDVWFTHNLEKVGGVVAPYEVCKRFSVETEYQLGTLGYHAIDKHLSPKECEQIFSQYGSFNTKTF